MCAFLSFHINSVNIEQQTDVFRHILTREHVGEVRSHHDGDSGVLFRRARSVVMVRAASKERHGLSEVLVVHLRRG